LELITSPSMTRRREALCEIVKRGPTPAMMSGLTRIALRPGELYGRVAALLALARVGGEDAQGTLSMLASHGELREFALRALADREDLARDLKPELFVTSLKDRNPRVRVQAAIALGHVRYSPVVASTLIPVTADADPMVSHAAMQALRRLNAIDPLISNLKSQSSDFKTTSACSARFARCMIQDR
jgi:HEAT repeat protein